MGRSDEGGVDARRGSPADEPWIGVNFWSRAGGPRMWTRYDGAIVRDELEVLAAHGLNVTRSFCYWPDFVPEPERLDGDVLDRFADFLDAHVERGLGTIPTFIVGHMSGQNWDPAWRHGRDLYRDTWLVSQQAWFAGRDRPPVRAPPRVVGWLVSNEMPLYGGPASAEEIGAWARLVVQAVRAAGATQPISLGDGAWGSRGHGARQRLLAADARPARRLRRAAQLSDAGRRAPPAADARVHVRARGQLRQARDPRGVRRQLRLRRGRPRGRLLPPGAAHDAPRRRARLARLVQRRLRRAASRGPLPAPPLRAPLRLTDGEGRPKPALLELERFAALVRDLTERGFERVAGDAAIVVPSTSSACSRSPSSRTATTCATTCCRATSPRARPTCRSSSSASGRDLRRRPALPPAGRQGADGPGRRPAAPARGRGRTVYASYFAGSTPTSAARGWARSRSSSAFAIAFATASSTRSRTTRSCSSWWSRSATWR